MLASVIKNPFFDYESEKDLANAIVKRYPFIDYGTIGESLCGRDIDYLSLGNRDNAVLFVGGVHGMEWLTSLVLLLYLERLSDAYEKNGEISGINIKPYLDEQGIVIVPMLNPDGVEISLHGEDAACAYKNLVRDVSNGNTASWQANARGVDINHNFDANWEVVRQKEGLSNINGPAPTRYGGPSPLSEPESEAIIKFFENNNFKHLVAFHSQGEEIYWEFGENTPIQSDFIAKIMAASSGYKVSQPQGLAYGGGLKDMIIDKFRKPAFTIEIGKGKNPLPIDDLFDIYRKIEEMLVFATVV